MKEDKTSRYQYSRTDSLDKSEWDTTVYHKIELSTPILLDFDMTLP